MPIPKGTTNVRIPDFPHTYMGEPYSGEEKVRKDEKMYIYFGYFSPGHSIYCVFTKEEIPINYFRLKKT
ncbi:MAG: hypothetical protein PF518_04885 [Spirochaetaceae bacterium]|jgi:hypothetical protein|nr:hypothetical protein [Spirochaetaceae bacterium]